MTSDALPDRKIAGLPSRPGGGTPDLRRLRKQNRELTTIVTERRDDCNWGDI